MTVGELIDVLSAIDEDAVVCYPINKNGTADFNVVDRVIVTVVHPNEDNVPDETIEEIAVILEVDESIK